ncbi:hypothetical protein [Microcoleus sp. herbarium12]|jgi:FtsZ-binding cell division protein ZapB|uniref:hypothetical protein n=1 Tax=Microcoleus sp. herbarium12 TaxID=3055437 RepID=UPI002FD29D2A
MQNTTLSDNTNPENSNSYSPSVPISLYREVTAELQAAQAMLDSLKTHNQQLVQQNQQLRREVETVVQVSQQLQQVVNSAQNVTQTGIPQMPSVKFNFSVEPEPQPPAPQTLRASSAVPQPPQTVAFPFPLPEPTVPPMPNTPTETLFTEVPETPYRIRSQPKKASDLSGLWLAVAIFLIVIAAFGAGYLVVRPLLKGK